MENLKVGDIIVGSANQDIEIRAVLGNIIFSRVINDDGSKSMTSFDELEDLITLGFKLKK